MAFHAIPFQIKVKLLFYIPWTLNIILSEENYNSMMFVAKYWVFIYEPHYDHNDLFFWISSSWTQSKNYKYLELEEINHFDDQHHLQNLKEDLCLL